LSRSTWTRAAWDDDPYWRRQDRKTVGRANALIAGRLPDPLGGIGKPEPLRETVSGFWSRRIDEASRLVHCVEGKDLVVIACRDLDRCARLWPARCSAPSSRPVLM